jgi:hypothetical protein
MGLLPPDEPWYKDWGVIVFIVVPFVVMTFSTCVKEAIHEYKKPVKECIETDAGVP